MPTPNRGCPFAQNLVAEEIKSIVDSYRATAAATETLRYVTILGDDTVVPFFRYPDQSLLGQESGYFPPTKSDSISEASLRRDYVLSQDAYGAGTEVDIRTTAFPIPDLAVGRLVETPAEIVGMIDAYIDADGVVSPDSGARHRLRLPDRCGRRRERRARRRPVADARRADHQRRRLATAAPAAGHDGPADLVVGCGRPPRLELLGERHDLVFLAGHFSANSALAADYQTQVVTTELAASSVDLENSIVISAGCHAGYNLVDDDALAGVALPLDWAQAFAQKRAVLVAGTGYQYGDTDFLEYSERLYRDFAWSSAPGPPARRSRSARRSPRRSGPTSQTTQDIRGIHEKAVLEATLFGLPMFGVDFPTGRTGTPAAVRGASRPTPVAADLPRRSASPRTTSRSRRRLTPPPPRVLDVIGAAGVTGTVTATWLEGPDGVVTNPAEPALPKEVVDVTATSDDLVLRGVGFRGGTYTDASNVLPLSGAPTTELRGVHAPFVSPVFYPMRMWTSNYFGEFDVGWDEPDRHAGPASQRSRRTPNRSIRRVFNDLDLRLFYADAPTLLGGGATPTPPSPTRRRSSTSTPRRTAATSSSARASSAIHRPPSTRSGSSGPMAAARGRRSTSSNARLRCRLRAPGSTTRESGPDD